MDPELNVYHLESNLDGRSIPDKLRNSDGSLVRKEQHAYVDEEMGEAQYYEFLYEYHKYFRDDSWDRKINDDQYNYDWESRAKHWWSAASWVNYVDEKIFTKNNKMLRNYTFLYYYAMLTLFQNELGPVNNIEFFCIFIMLMGSIFFSALVFSEIFVIWDVLIKKSLVV